MKALAQRPSGGEGEWRRPGEPRRSGEPPLRAWLLRGDWWLDWEWCSSRLCGEGECGEGTETAVGAEDCRGLANALPCGRPRGECGLPIPSLLVARCSLARQLRLLRLPTLPRF